MKKTMLPLAFVIPLVAFISPPAVAHNQMCCVGMGPAPQPPPPDPQPSPPAATPCPDKFSDPVNAFCRLSANPSDFCEEFSPPLREVSVTRTTWHFKLVILPSGQKACMSN